MSNFFFLHHSPVQCANWLNDFDAPNAYRYSEQVISNAIQLYIAEDVQHLRRFDDTYMSIHVYWIMENIDHALWAYDYYCALQTRFNKQHRHDNFLTHLFMRKAIQLLPHNKWSNPPLANMPSTYSLLQCDDITKWRLYYANARKGTFRKVKPPFWLHTMRA